MTATPESSERVLVLLEGPACESALELAATLAARRRARLIALVVEDVDLLTAADLPFAREIGLASGTARPVSTAGLRARLSDRAARLRRLVERTALRRGIEAELQVGRGRQARTALAHTRPDDLLVLCRTDWAQRPGGAIEGVATEARCTVMLVGPHGAHGAHGPMVLLDGTEGAGRALETALALARDERRPLSLVVAPGVGPTARKRARARLAERGIEADFIDLLRLDGAGLLRAIRRERPWLVLIARDSPILGAPGDGPRLRAELDDVPLMIVS